MSERDPHGLDAHMPGAKLDDRKPRPTLLLRDFSRAIAAVLEVGEFGARKYTDAGWLSVADDQARYTDALLRHLLAELTGEPCDRDSTMRHAAHAAWNALARLELQLRANPQRHSTDPAVPPSIRFARDPHEAVHVTDCPTCGGTGVAPGYGGSSTLACPNCRGSGECDRSNAHAAARTRA